MSRFLVEKRQMIPVEVEPGQLVSMKEAAKILDIMVQSLAGMMDRGIFVVYEDTEAANPRRRRRFLLRSDVLEEASKRRGDGE